MAHQVTVRTNIPALNVHRNIRLAGNRQATAAAQLASGFRINSAADDAAGLAISETMRAQIRGLDQAARNTQDGIALIQTADGAIATVSEMLLRMRELIVQAANDTNTLINRQQIQYEINQIMNEINSLANRVEFNSMRLLDGSLARINSQTKSPAFMPLSGGASPLNTLVSSTTFPPGTHGFVTVPPGSSYERQDRRFVYRYLAGGYSVMDQVDILTLMGNNERIIIADIYMAAGTDIYFLIYFSREQGQEQVPLSALEELILIAPDGTVFDLTEFGISFPNTNFVDNMSILNMTDYSMIRAYGVSISGYWRLEAATRYTYPSLPRFITQIASTVVQPTYPDPPIPPPLPTIGRTAERRNALWLQLGANANQGIRINLPGMNTKNLGGRHGDLHDLINVVSLDGGQISHQLKYIDYASAYVNSARSKLGAVQNRLEHTARSLLISSENLSDAKSRIRNTDMAKKMMRFTKASIIKQAGLSFLSHAIQSPDRVLQLLS
ncbi:MAG: hypothetical protein FWB91_00800 [Defluviitaleaceae bacterium]|nr:hypothetical protein [Defluviitaleaceae bacterium]